MNIYSPKCKETILSTPIICEKKEPNRKILRGYPNGQ